MSLNRYAKRRDKNERELTEIAEKLGMFVVQAPPLDLWVCIAGRWVPVEVKDRTGKYTKAQLDFITECGLRKMIVRTWRNASDIWDTWHEVLGQ